MGRSGCPGVTARHQDRTPERQSLQAPAPPTSSPLAPLLSKHHHSRPCRKGPDGLDPSPCQHSHFIPSPAQLEHPCSDLTGHPRQPSRCAGWPGGISQSPPHGSCPCPLSHPSELGHSWLPSSCLRKPPPALLFMMDSESKAGPGQDRGSIGNLQLPLGHAKSAAVSLTPHEPRAQPPQAGLGPGVLVAAGFNP